MTLPAGYAEPSDSPVLHNAIALTPKIHAAHAKSHANKRGDDREQRVRHYTCIAPRSDQHRSRADNFSAELDHPFDSIGMAGLSISQWHSRHSERYARRA